MCVKCSNCGKEFTCPICGKSCDCVRAIQNALATGTKYCTGCGKEIASTLAEVLAEEKLKM